MKKEIEDALRNIDTICSGALLSRQQHAVLAQNMKLIHDALVTAEVNAKPVKKDPKDGNKS